MFLWINHIVCTSSGVNGTPQQPRDLTFEARTTLLADHIYSSFDAMGGEGAATITTNALHTYATRFPGVKSPGYDRKQGSSQRPVVDVVHMGKNCARNY